MLDLGRKKSARLLFVKGTVLAPLGHPGFQAGLVRHGDTEVTDTEPDTVFDRCLLIGRLAVVIMLMATQTR